ncbi:MAG: DegT/DnrJ/EryC1/StrS family aminotransferase [Crocinitomicaceae bacterium]
MIPLARVEFTDKDLKAVENVLRSGMLVQGSQVADLESEFCKYTGAKYSIAVSNGTASLHLMLLTHDIGPGDEVIIPSFSYVATANVVEVVGACPVFVDTFQNSNNIDVDRIVAKINEKTKAILIVNEFGLCADLFKIREICNQNNILLLEDSACAMGATIEGKHSGTIGQSGSFSFHPRKAITSGEGGMIITDDEEFAVRIKTLRNHGIHPKTNSFSMAGLNYRMTDFQAALLRSQLECFDTMLSKRTEIAEVYLSKITNPKLLLPNYEMNKKHSWQTFHIILEDSLNRDEVIQHLKEKGIGTNYGAQCIPEVEYYKKKYKLDSKSLFPNAYRAYMQGLAIPLYPQLKSEEILYIADELNKL